MKLPLPTFVFAAFLAAALNALLPVDALAAETVRIQATLIQGSNEGAGVDRRLGSYERHLKRVFPFDSFQQQGSGTASVGAPGAGQIVISREHLVRLEVSDAGDGKLRIATNWSSGGRTLISTTVVTPRNQPTVLGGPSSNGGKLILLLVAR